MLRITADDRRRVLSLRLEGRLEGPWVGELDKCWRGMVARLDVPELRVDLTGVTFADPAGMAQLVAMHRQGAEFIADDCLTKEIVSEILAHDRAGASSSRKDLERAGGANAIDEVGQRSALVTDG
jgi:ABC-type transporter Mla MlaB component